MRADSGSRVDRGAPRSAPTGIRHGLTATVDLVIAGGTVVTGSSRSRCDVGVEAGRIAALGHQLSGDRVIDARGMLVLPGGVDAHVHFTPASAAYSWVDDFATGSRAAAVGGITTVGNMTSARDDETLLTAMARVRREAETQSVVDFILHPVIRPPRASDVADIAALAAAGHGSLKLFMTDPAFDVHVAACMEAMQAAAAHGMTVLVHCEDQAVLAHRAAALIGSGRCDVRAYADSRPDYAEASAVARAASMARAAGARLYIVHLSSRAALSEARRARQRGQDILVETRPEYLYFTRDRLEAPTGALYVGAPPLREPADVEALWSGLRGGAIQTLGSDHAPWLRAHKLDPSQNVATLRQGLGVVDVMLPVLFSRGVTTSRLSLERFVALTATNPARVFGLYPAKGTIAVGSDADLTIWDPDAEWTLSDSGRETRADYNVYAGWSLRGRPRTTIVRGEVVVDRGEVVGPHPRGRFLPAAGGDGTVV